MITNPIKYTSRTFQSILNDINSDATLVDKPNWWKRLWAGIGDVLSMWLNSMVNLLFLRTSYTRQSVSDLCELIDYQLAPHTTSIGTMIYNLDSSGGTAIFPFTSSAGSLSARSQGSMLVSAKRFEQRLPVLFQQFTDTVAYTQYTNATGLISSMITEASLYLGFIRRTGYKVQFQDIFGNATLPSPLKFGKDYYVIRISATSIKLATSMKNAFAGIYIVFSGTPAHSSYLNFYGYFGTSYQQTSLASSISVGISDAITPWQEFGLPDTFVLEDTLSVTINSIVWTKVSTFVNSTATDKVFKLIRKQDNKFSIRFADGTYGAIPPAFDIVVNYAFGGGSASNVTTLNLVNNYAGTDARIKECANVSSMVGGSDAENISSAKIIAPMLLKARDRFVTEADGEALVKAYGGISLVKVIRNYYGLLTAKIVGISYGGGYPDSATRTAISQYLTDRSILESITVSFPVPTITPVAVTSSAKMKSGYTYTGGVDKYFRLAWELFLTETGQEIIDNYLNYGIESATLIINTNLSESFVASDYIQIQRLLDNFQPRYFGDVIYASDIDAFIQSNVFGVDYMTTASFGTGLPFILGSDEITTVGTLTLAEIP